MIYISDNSLYTLRDSNPCRDYPPCTPRCTKNQGNSMSDAKVSHPTFTLVYRSNYCRIDTSILSVLQRCMKPTLTSIQQHIWNSTYSIMSEVRPADVPEQLLVTMKTSVLEFKSKGNSASSIRDKVRRFLCFKIYLRTNPICTSR